MNFLETSEERPHKEGNERMYILKLFLVNVRETKCIHTLIFVV